jgi:phage baseplate assembly protein gpV
MNRLHGKWPGEVASYDGDARICRVRINGITDGSTDLPEAVFCNPLGDRASDTEIRILVNDPVWIEFEAGDPRFPIIVGYRTPRKGNPTEWRRWRHANMELTADGQMRLISGVATVMQAGQSISLSAGDQITLGAPKINLNGASEVNVAAPKINLNGGTEINLTAPNIKTNGSIGGSGATMNFTATTSMTIDTPSLVILANTATTGTLTNNGKNVGSTHTHGGVLFGGASTAVPN